METNTANGSGPLAGRREWVGLAVLALPTLLLSLDISVLYLALPHLSADLGASSTQQLWIMDIYTFMLAGFLITMGTLGDRIGRRRLLMVGAATFGLASALAAFSTNPGMLIATRALMGISGATLMPSTLALISNMFREAGQRGTAIGVWASCMMVGAALGPVVGGVLLGFFWWGSVFLMGIPVMVLLLATGPVLLPEYRDSHAGRLDLSSVALSLAAILPMIYALKEAAKEGLGMLPILALVVGGAFGLAFVFRQRRLESPLLDLRLFGNRSFSTALAIIVLGGIPLSGIFLLVSQHLQAVMGLPPARAGLWLAPVGIAIAIGATASPGIARRVRPGYVIAAGMVSSAIGCLLLTQIDVASGLAALVVGIVLVYLGVGPSMALGVDLVIGSAPPEKAGSASATSETSTELGVALGIALLGSLGTAVYRGQITVPNEVPTEQGQIARDNINGAVSVAEQLPSGPAAQLLESAGEAFSTGLNTAAGVGAVLFVALAVLAALLLRHVRPSGEPEGEPDPEQERTTTGEVGVETAPKVAQPRREIGHEPGDGSK